MPRVFLNREKVKKCCISAMREEKELYSRVTMLCVLRLLFN